MEKCNKNGFTFKLSFSKTYSLHQNRPGFASLPVQKEMNHSALRDALTTKYHKHCDFQPETNFKHALLNTYEDTQNLHRKPEGYKSEQYEISHSSVLPFAEGSSIFPQQKPRQHAAHLQTSPGTCLSAVLSSKAPATWALPRLT